MKTPCKNSSDSKERRAEHALLAEFAYLIHQLPELRGRPLPEYADYLSDLGLPDSLTHSVLGLLGKLSVAEYVTGEEQVLHWDLPRRCPIGWKPSVLFPVIAYAHEYDESDGAPGAMEIFYPTGRPIVPDISFLAGCGRYPVVILLHGHCQGGDREQYKRWLGFAARVARSGYVVVVPDLPSISSPFSGASVDRAEEVLVWIRSEWEHREHLMVPPATAVVGHSNGALVGAQLVTRIEASAYVSLSGAWRDGYSRVPQLLREIPVPRFFAWSTNKEWLDDDSLGHLWDAIQSPKHRLVFADGGHWDYLYNSKRIQACENWRLWGPCSLVPRLAADYTSLFLSRYMPPEGAGIDGLIPPTLVPPAVQRTALQELAATHHLSGLKSLPLHPECSAVHSFEIPELLFKPTSINFGNVRVGQTAARSLMMENATGHHLSVVFSAPNEPFDWLSHSIAIFNGQERSILMEFKPKAVGIAETTLTVTPFTDSGPAIAGTVKIRGNGMP